MAKKWLQKARASMERKGTVGSFTRSAKKSGQTVAQKAKSVLKKGSKASTKQKRRAIFAKNMQAIARKRKGK